MTDAAEKKQIIQDLHKYGLTTCTLTYTYDEILHLYSIRQTAQKQNGDNRKRYNLKHKSSLANLLTISSKWYGNT